MLHDSDFECVATQEGQALTCLSSFKLLVRHSYNIKIDMRLEATLKKTGKNPLGCLKLSDLP